MLTKREIFEKVKAHLLTQNKKAAEITYSSPIDDTGTRRTYEACFYLTPDGLRCAVGCLLTEVYKPEMEKMSIDILFADFPGEMEAAGLSKKGHLTLLSRLQIIHDKFPVEYWEEQLNIVEREFKLA